MILRRLNEEEYARGKPIPTFWAVAWFDYVTRQLVIAPIGINRIASLIRTAWWYLNGKPFDPQAPMFIDMLGEEYGRGYKAGRSDGERIGFDEGVMRGYQNVAEELTKSRAKQ